MAHLNAGFAGFVRTAGAPAKKKLRIQRCPDTSGRGLRNDDGCDDNNNNNNNNNAAAKQCHWSKEEKS